MSKIDGAEVLVRALVQERTRIAFAIPDISYSPVQRSAAAHGLHVVGGRHESANVHMADGWYRATGEMAVAMGGMGPGVANTVPGVITAWIEGIPLLLIASQRNRRAHHSIRRGKFQYTPQIDVFRPITKFAGAVPDAKRIPEYVREAFRMALLGRPGPVYLEIGDEIFREVVDTNAIEFSIPGRYRFTPTTPDPGLLGQARAMLAEARFPIVLAGRGVVAADASGELKALVEESGALLITSLGARGSVSEEHPQLLMYNTPGGTTATREADLVLAVGTQIGELLAYGRAPRWGQPEKQRWIQIDSDPSVIGANRAVDIGLVADAKEALAGLLAGVRRDGAKRAVSAKAQKCVDLCRRTRVDIAGDFASGPEKPIAPGRLAREVADSLPEDAIVCLDGGNTVIWGHLYNRFHKPRSLLWTSQFGHLGTGLPYAVAAKLAHPTRPVVLFTGDSAFGFNIHELETAARVNAKIVVVINCDYAWAMEGLALQLEIGSPLGVATSKVRYDQVALGLGCHGELVEEASAIRPALQRAFAANRPAVVQVLVDPKKNLHPPGLIEFAQVYASHDA